MLGVREGGGRLHASDSLLREVLTGVIKALNETVADAVGGALEAVELGEVEPGAAQRVLDVLYNVGLEALLVVAEVSEKDVTIRYISAHKEGLNYCCIKLQSKWWRFSSSADTNEFDRTSLPVKCLRWSFGRAESALLDIFNEKL